LKKGLSAQQGAWQRRWRRGRRRRRTTTTTTTAAARFETKTWAS